MHMVATMESGCSVRRRRFLKQIVIGGKKVIITQGSDIIYGEFYLDPIMFKWASPIF